MGEEILYQVKVDGYCVAREMQIGIATLLTRALFEYNDYEDENVVVSIQREKCNDVCKIGVVGDED